MPSPLTTPEPIRKWAIIRSMVASFHGRLGHLALQEYATKGPGQQIGRFDTEADIIQHWLDNGPSIEEDPDPAADGALRIAAEVDAEGEDDGSEVEDPDAEDGEAEDEEAEADDEDEEAEADDEDEKAEAEEPEEPEGKTFAGYTEADYLRAVKKWVLSVCESNTPAGDEIKFRLRVHELKGRQLWSTVFSFRSSTAPLPGERRVLPKAEPLAVAEAPSEAQSTFGTQAAAPPPAKKPLLKIDDPTNPLGLTDEEFDLTRFLSMPPPPPQNPPNGHGAPNPVTPTADTFDSREIDDLAGITSAATKAEAGTAIQRVADAAMTRSQGQGQHFAPYEVVTLVHLHGLARSVAQSSVKASEDVLGVVAQANRIMLDGIKELAEIKSGLVDQLAEALRLSRERENLLIDTLQDWKVKDAELDMEDADRDRKHETRAVLGKAAIDQLGLGLRAFIALKRKELAAERGDGEEDRPSLFDNDNGEGAGEGDDGGNGEGSVDDYVEAEVGRGSEEPGAEGSNGHSIRYETDAASGSEGANGHEGANGRSEPQEPKNGRLSAAAQEKPLSAEEEKIIRLLGWLEKRPDVVDALTNKNVQTYLKKEENVTQLTSLASMVAEASDALGGDEILDPK